MPNDSHNARVRLTAGTINNLGAALAVAGIGVLVFSDMPWLWRGVAAAAAVLVGVLLHLGARAYLGYLKP